MEIKNSGNCKILPLFLFVILALGCGKGEIVENDVKVDDDSPVAIKLTSANPSYLTSKAAVDRWDRSEISVFGLKRKKGIAVGEGTYDFDDRFSFADYQTLASSGASVPVEVYADNEAKIPYFYSEGYVYDFYGYHLGGASAEEALISGDAFSRKITFDGSNDVMFATTDREKDVLTASSPGVRAKDVYTAWSARRSVQPTLVFQHALTRFNFIIKGAGDKYQDVTIKGIDVNGVINTGTLTVTGTELGFVQSADAQPVALTLKDVDGQIFTLDQVTENAEGLPAGGEGACVMVAPGLEEIEIILHMVNNKYGDFPIDDYRFVAKASEIKHNDENGNSLPVTSFDAGKAYDFYIYVYGPEKIDITAKLTDWVYGGMHEYNPDDSFSPDNGDTDDPSGNQPETHTISADGGSVEIPVSADEEYDVYVPDKAKDWITVVMPTKAEQEVIQIIVQPNNTSQRRSAIVLIATTGGVTVETVRITQESEGGETEDPDVPVNPEDPEEPEIPVVVTGVALNITSQELTEGDIFTLEATVNPYDAANQNVTWTSSNQSVAKVADGVVTAVAPGTAIITVTTEDGGFTATCHVTVKAKKTEGGNEGVGEEAGNGTFN